MTQDDPDGLCAEEIGVVAFVIRQRIVAIPIHHAVRGVPEMVDLADQAAVVTVEPALLRPVFPLGVAEMPLAHRRGPVSRVMQRLRQQKFVEGKAVGAGRRE